MQVTLHVAGDAMLEVYEDLDSESRDVLPALAKAIHAMSSDVGHIVDEFKAEQGINQSRNPTTIVELPANTQGMIVVPSSQ